MKITRKQLKKLILKELKNTYNQDNILGTGGAPPNNMFFDGGEGGGNCPPEKMDRYYTQVFDTFGLWIESTFPMTQQGNTSPDQYLQFLEMNYPDFSMDLVSDNYNEFFELIMTIIAEFACKRNIEDLTRIYRNPMTAIQSF